MHFTYASIQERIVICSMERELDNVRVQEITPIDSSIKYDCKLSSGGTQWIVEIKNRYVSSNTYPDFWIEMDKLIDLKYYSELYNEPAKFILHFEDRSLLWDVDDLYNRWKNNETKPITRNYAKYSCLNKEVKADKEVLPIKREWAADINFKRKNKIELDNKSKEWYNQNSTSALFNTSWTRTQTVGN